MKDVIASSSPVRHVVGAGPAPWLLVGEALALAAVAVRDPHEPGSWGGCPVLALTGAPCPFCGGLRAAADLVHGRFPDAWSSNAYGVVVIVLGLVATTWWALVSIRSAASGRPWPGRDARGGTAALVAVAVLLGWVAFGAVRLTPLLAWARP